LLWGGKPAEIVSLAEEGKVSIFTSEEIIMEISQVLTFSKLKKIYEAKSLRRDQLLEAVLRIARLVKATKTVNVICEHPADNKFLECAQASEADYLVSGDKHVLNVIRYRKTKLLSVNQFLQILETKEKEGK
jgi:hypothetical protein